MENCQKSLFELHCKPEFEEIKKEGSELRNEVKQNHKEIMKLLNGNGADGIIVRLDRNERWRTMISWGIGIVYAAIVGWLISKL